MVIAEVPFPIESAEQIVEAVLAKVSARTKLVLLDHISSQTALIFPIQTLIQRLAAQGIDVLVGGAHAPGMVALNLQELGAEYYSQATVINGCVPPKERHFCTCDQIAKPPFAHW